MLVGDAEAKLTAVLKSLSETPRTAYEVDNLYRLNRERIAAARAALADMSGDYVDRLRARCNEAEKQAEAKHAAGVAGTAAVDNAFSLDFEMEEAEEALAAELENAKEAVGTSKRSTKKSSSGKDKTKKSKHGEGNKKEKRTFDDSPTPAPDPRGTSESATGSPAEVAEAACVVLAREEDLASSDLPAVLATCGRGRCVPVTNTPLARVFFAEPVDWDGAPSRCAVELYRCVVIALTYGEPELSWAECQAKVQQQTAASAAPITGTSSKEAAKASRQRGEPEDAEGGDDKVEEETGNSNAAEENEMQEDADVLTLSEQLVAEYDLAQLAEEEQDLNTSVLPRDVSEKLQLRLRGFTNAVWVILLCHGGYFAGGVFVRGACVLHKAFQRYVVRKKQGGKQSSNAKDAGSYNSVGSQIRAAQEVKWRVDVRDILLEWTPYVEAASFILYAAPGPQNRAVLTDFSLLPAAAAIGGSKGTSPIQLKDPRVSRVPLTTHRPTYEEVQRVYAACSHCSLLYVAASEDDA